MLQGQAGGGGVEQAASSRKVQGTQGWCPPAPIPTSPALLFSRTQVPRRRRSLSPGAAQPQQRTGASPDHQASTLFWTLGASTLSVLPGWASPDLQCGQDPGQEAAGAGEAPAAVGKPGSLVHRPGLRQGATRGLCLSSEEACRGRRQGQPGRPEASVLPGASGRRGLDVNVSCHRGRSSEQVQRVGLAAAGVTPPPQVTHVDLWLHGPARGCWYPGVLTSE